MKQHDFGMKVLMGLITVGGIASAIVATPILFALDSQQPPKVEKFTLEVKGMKGSQDADKIKNELRQNPAITLVRCDQASAQCNIAIDPDKVKKEDVAVTINRLGFQAFLQH